MDNRNGKQEILESFKELGELEEVLDGIRQAWG